MSAIRIEVRGMPAPQGSKKFVGMHGGRGLMVESSKKVKPWREDVRVAVLQAISGAAVMMDAADGKPYRGMHDGPRFFPMPFDLPLRVRMVFTLPKAGERA